MRLFSTDDMFSISNYTLDKWTNTFSMNFYLTYMTKWPDMFFTEEAPNGEVVGIGVGKVEGELAPEKMDWHDHVSVLTIAPEYRRLGYSKRFMKYMEDVSEIVDDAFFMDLFVRTDNRSAVSFYNSLDYHIYRRLVQYYNEDKDAFEMRRALRRDVNRVTIIRPKMDSVNVKKMDLSLSTVSFE